MKKKNTVNRYIPVKAVERVNELLKQTKNSYLEPDNIYYILDLVYRIPTFKRDLDKDFNGFVPIQASKLKEVMGGQYVKYLKFLVDNKILETDDLFIAGIKSKSYRFYYEFLSQLVAVKIQPDTKIWNYIIKEKNARYHNFSREPIYIKKMKKKFYDMEFDFEKAYDWIEQNIENEIISEKRRYISDVGKITYKQELKIVEKKAYLYRALKSFEERDLYFKRNKRNRRLDSNLTNLNKKLRQFIKGDLIIIDLSNSHPVLFNYLLFKICDIERTNKTNLINNNIEINNKSLCFQEDMKSVINHFSHRVISKARKIPQKNQIAFFEEFLMYHKWTMLGNFYENFKEHYNSKMKDIKRHISREDA